jgi:membrane protease YdiL (CAAX protease family)
LEISNSDLILVALRLIGLAFFGGAVTLDLFFLFRISGADNRLFFPSVNSIKLRGAALPVALLALATTLIFTLPNQLFKSDTDGAAVLNPDGILFGSLLYGLAVSMVVLFAAMHSRQSVAQLFISDHSDFRSSIRKGILYGIAAVPPVFLITVVMSILIEHLGLVAESQPVIDWLINPATPVATRIVIIFCAVIIAPIIEEVIFRGVLFSAVLRNNSFVLSALLVGCVFSLIHFHAPSFLSILVLNLFFCAGYALTGSLITPIVMHMIFNGTATFMALTL